MFALDDFSLCRIISHHPKLIDNATKKTFLTPKHNHHVSQNRQIGDLRLGKFPSVNNRLRER